MKQVVRLFYNREGIGDVLLVRFGSNAVAAANRSGDICSLLDDQGQLVGYNIFHASVFFGELPSTGYFVSAATLETLNQVLQIRGYEQLDIDTSHKFFVGEITNCENHPKSDHLHVCKINLANNVLDIVCGAANAATGKRVVCAVSGAVLPDGTLIEDSSLLGVPSSGMLCSYKELQIPIAGKGIIELDDSYVIGSEFHWEG